MSTPKDSPANSAPQDVATTFANAVAAHKAGNLAAAESGYRSVLVHDPDKPEPNYLLGAVLWNSGRFELALDPLTRCCQAAPGHVDALSMLGAVYAKLDQPEQALNAFEKAAAAAKTNPTCWLNYARALTNVKRFDAAERAYRTAFDLDPGQWTAGTGIAQCMIETGRFEEAAAVSRSVVDQHPKDPMPYATLIKSLLESKEIDDAESECVSAEKLWPSESCFPLLHGQIKQHAGDRAGARLCYDRALEIDPDSVEGLNRLANLLNEDGQWKDAEGLVRRSLELAPDKANMLTLMGRIRQLRGDLEGARVWYNKAIQADTGYAEAYNNLGNLLSYMDLNAQAEEAFDRAEALKPDSDGIKVNAAIARMTTGHLSDRWEDYRRRFTLGEKNIVERPWPYPAWQGESLAGKRLLLWTEQGIGDQILFGRYAPGFINEAGSGVLECPRRLVTLFQRSFPDTEMVPETGAPDVGAIDGPVDCHASVIDVCCARIPTPSAVPQAPLLLADPKRTKELRQKYRDLTGNRPLVGIAWRSGGTHTSHFKSTDLLDWGPILKNQDAAVVSLQYGDVTSEIKAVEDQMDVPVLTDTDIDPLGDLDPYAAQIAAMDLVITTSNAAAHLAGALGKPVWNLTPTGPGRIWYWFNTGKTTPWYPSMTLFRHSHIEGWTRVIADAGEKLHRTTPDLIET